MAKTEQAGGKGTAKATAAKDAVVKGGAGKKADAKPAPKGTRQVPAGTLTGPKGGKLQETGAQHEVPVEQRQGERRQQQTNAMQQFTQSQMQTPAAHELTEDQKKQLAFNDAVAKLANDMGMPVPQFGAATKAPRQSTRVQQNGITRPDPGSTCGKIWATADAISLQQQGAPAQISQLKAHPDMKHVNDHTIKTQYARWRAFNGVKGRLQVIQVPASPAGQDAGLEAAMPQRRATDQPAVQ